MAEISKRRQQVSGWALVVAIVIAAVVINVWNIDVGELLTRP